MGAWIEIQVGTCVAIVVIVAPLVGAWIEIPKECLQDHLCTSLPSWERGLKSSGQLLIRLLSGSLPPWERGLKSTPATVHAVAPLVGAWIEIVKGGGIWAVVAGRSPRGSVD